MRTFDALVARLRSPEAGGFGGVTAPRIGEVVNEAIRRFAALSLWVTDEREIATTVADQDTYELSDDVIDVLGLMVADSSRWQRASTKQMWGYRTGERSLSVNYGGAFAPRFGPDGLKKIGLFPTPSESGLSIWALAAVMPADLSGTDVPPFPEDHEDTLLAFALETLYSEVDENVTTGQYYGQKARAGAEALRRRANSRIGSGPVQAQIMGVHFT